MEMDRRLINWEHDRKKRTLSLTQATIQMVVYYSSEDRRWYTSFDPGLQDIMIKSGRVKLTDLPKRKSVEHSFSFCLEDKNEVLFLKDESGHFGFFTMAFDGLYYCSDRGGFCYKSARFYFDTWTRPLESSVHYLTTENLNGQWALIRICCPQRYDRNHRIRSINLGVERKCIIKGCGSEQEALAYLVSLGGPDFKDAKRYISYDLTDGNSQSVYEVLYPDQINNRGAFMIDGNVMEVSEFFSIDSSNSWRRCSISLWPTSQLRQVWHVNDNNALFLQVQRLCSSRNGEGIDLEFHKVLQDFAVQNGIRYWIRMEEESRDYPE